MAANLLAQAIRAKVHPDNYLSMFTSNLKSRPGVKRVKIWGLKGGGGQVSVYRNLLSRYLKKLGFKQIEFTTPRSGYNNLHSLAVYAVPPASIPAQVPKKRNKKPVQQFCQCCGHAL